MEEPSPLKAADPVKRIVAAVIDLLIAALLGWIPILGGLLAAAFWLVRDGLDIPFMDFRSPGKRLVRIRPVTIDGSKVGVATSLTRNWMFVLGVILWPLLFIPVLGWILIVLLVVPVVLVGAAILIMEFVFVLTDDRGRRWGDRLAGTIVIEVDS